MSASKSPRENIVVEPMNGAGKDFAMAYRIKISNVRADVDLLVPGLWPTGMVVAKWKGPWYQLKPKTSIKVFVGNLSTNAKPSWIAQRLQKIYTDAGVDISSASAEVFKGKKESNCLNLVVTLNAAKPGITMEPIQQARINGLVPPRLYVRKFGDLRESKPGETWGQNISS